MEDKFIRARELFGDENFAKFRRASVLVCGCGGVGGACIEALARTGIGRIVALDYDVFEASNQNRQILSERVGEKKSSVFAEYFESVEGLDLRLSEESVGAFDFSGFDVVIDAIDDIPAKVALAKAVSEKLISSMGAARRLDPTQIRSESVWKTSGDPFARKFRAALKEAGFEGDFTAVYSSEPLYCATLGSFMGVTAAFGLALASLAVRKIAQI